jgi:competence protein ComEC
MLSMVKIFGNPKYSFVTIKQFSLYDSVLFYSCLGFLFTQLKRFTNKSSKIIFVSLMIMVFEVYSWIDNNELMPPNTLSVLFIDVGQGESILIKFPNQKTALIDAGDANERFDNGKRIIMPLLDKLGISKIDYGFVSHVDADHYLGFISLIKEGRVQRIFKPALDTAEVKDQKFESVLKKLNIPISYYHREIISIGNSRIYVLNTAEKEKSKISSNDKSGMLKLVYGSSSTLFTGDASISAEKEYILRYGKFLQSEILKIGHHGSGTSTSESFLEIVNPDFGLISAGILNKFGHPSRKILERLAEHKINTLRTDLTGAILFQTIEDKLQLIDWKTK